MIKPIFNLTEEEQVEHDALVREGYESAKVTPERKEELIEAAKNTIARMK